MINKIVEKIKQYDKITIFNHSNIDGDSWSCSYGLLLAIRKKFPRKQVFWFADESDLAHHFPWLPYDKNVVTNEVTADSLVIIGDTASEIKLPFYSEMKKGAEIACFDHHRNPIDIEVQTFWSEPTYPASAIQAYEIAKALEVEFDEEVAFNLLLGILTDTGNFAYSLANPKPVNAFADLVSHVSNAKMDFFWTSLRRKSLRDIEIEQFFFNNLQFNGKVAFVHLNLKDAAAFADVNYKIKIHSIGNIENYPIWAIFVEVMENGIHKVKLHFRSNGPEVSKVAIAHGGGGHIRAAGTKIEFKSNTIESILKELNEL